MIDWDSIYAKTITATGWTWEYMDEFVTLPRLNALFEHWESYPPVHITAALFAGIKPAASKTPPRKIENLWQAADIVSDEHFRALMRPDIPIVHVMLPR